VLPEAVKEKGDDCDEMKRSEAANTRFGVSLINQYQHRGLTLEELIEAGEASLRNVIMNFDLNSGIKFITYAVTQIRQDIKTSTAPNRPKNEKGRNN
jgi:DNA-directed RNA polymerase sigma subunit (sigma70/sigma32)